MAKSQANFNDISKMALIEPLKMKTILISTIIFLFLSTISVGQENTHDTISFIDKHKYLKFLFEPAKDAQASLLSSSWQYLYSPWGKTFKTGGLHPSFGLNLARFFSNKFVLGVFFDLKGVKGFTQQKFSKEFLNDFNNSFITTYGSPSDSAKAYTVKDAINMVPGKDFWGNYYGNVGIILSPFPQKYGGIMISVKKGYRGYPIFGTYGNRFVEEGKQDNVWFELEGNYALGLTIKPWTLFRKANTLLANNDKIPFWYFIAVGFYYEKIYLKNATFDGMRFENMVNTGFINKYGVDNRYGITLGVAIY